MFLDHDGKISYARVSGALSFTMAILLVLANTIAHFKGLGPIPGSDAWILFFTGGGAAFGALTKVNYGKTTVRDVDGGSDGLP